MTLQQQLDSGRSRYQAGDLGEAEKIYREILAQRPDHLQTLNLMGTLAIQTGRPSEAVEFIRRAIRLKPDFAEAHGNLGAALAGSGQLEEAIASFREAARLKPDLAEMHNNLANALKKNGEFDEAVAAYRQVIRLRPDHADAHGNLGDVLKDLGRLDEAIAAYREAIHLKPDHPEAHYNLGNTLLGAGQLNEAISALRQAVLLKPDLAEAYSSLGSALKDNGQQDAAIACHKEAVRLKPDLAEAHSNFGNTLKEMGKYDEAAACHRRAIQLKPDLAEAHSNLGSVLREMGQIEEAIACHREAIRIKPDFVNAHSCLVFALNCDPNRNAEEILTEHRAWSDRHALPLMREMISHANDRSPERRLRIGYVSADFRRHSVGHFFAPLLEHHDRQSFEIFCYSNVQYPDGLSERMKRSCDVWRNIVGLGDEAVADLVRSDAIDILVDLSGHTAGNRLLVFARKPAPIQVTYLGYANTTGMAAIDYRLTDALADPPGMTDQLNVEKLWRLPGCAWCYEPPKDAAEVPPREDGPIIFGCFNAFAKTNSNLVALWAELLKRVPESRLLLKSAGAGESSSRQRILSRFAEHGVPSERIEMIGRIADQRQHLQYYHRVDVALDTYPYHGTTTTCEALWMGVPVMTLGGGTHVSRVGVSLLSCVGLPELVAQSAEEYVSIAVGLANDLQRLAELRRTLRSRMRQSPLMDAVRFARDIETAYRHAWRNWCGST